MKLAPPPQPAPAPRPRPPPAPAAPAVSSESLLQVVGVLVSLLENQREELRGHSALVAKLMRELGERMGMDAAEVSALRLSGWLHDVGKAGSYHLTALNVAQYEGHRAQAKKTFLTPVRLFDAAQLPKTCVDALAYLYERFDGQGFPERRAGKEIPFSARLLAVVESYADLVMNAHNPFRKTLSPKAAVEVLLRYGDRVLDPDLVDIFRAAVSAESAQGGPATLRARILLVDTAAEDTSVLELRLAEQGHEVVLARSAEQAYQAFQRGGVDAVITEVDLKPHDGFTLVEYIRKSRSGAEIPVFFLTSRADRASVDRGFSLGALDYIIKPAPPDVVAVKVRNALIQIAQRQGPRGVSGSLREMPLPDVLQVLSRTRKTGLLKVSSGGYVGEIQFGDGAIFNANYKHQRAAEAVYSMLGLTDGEFELDPNFTPGARVIHQSPEQLLLEGMRRVDEGGAADDEEVDFSATRIDDS